MFVHIWRMRARKKRVADYEKFGRQVTLPSLKKIDGCLGAHFIRIFEARKPEYLWVVFWKDHKALELARTSPLWREQIRNSKRASSISQFLSSWSARVSIPSARPRKKVKRPARAARSRKAEKAEQPEAEESGGTESSATALPGPTPDGE